MATKDLILKILTGNSDGYISGEELSKALNISRAAVWKAIKSLREDGYIINAATNKGYRLSQSSDVITEDDLRTFLPARYKNNPLYIYDTLDSTNIRAKQIALEAPRHGAVIIALQQTSGRGRLGRSFFSPKSGIYLSLIIKPRFDLSKSLLITSAAAVAVAEAVEAVCNKQPLIKWVNDVYLDDKKICGILTEGITNFETGQIEALIIGIGVNTSTSGFPKELSDTVGAVEGNYPKAALAAEIITRTLDFAENIDERTFIPTYIGKSMIIGKNITVYKGRYKTSPEDDLPGVPAKAIGIDDNGGLEVLYENGTQETLSTGEISIRF